MSRSQSSPNIKINPRTSTAKKANNDWMTYSLDSSSFTPTSGFTVMSYPSEQVSISPTFYARLFRTKVSRKAFLYLDLRFALCWHKNIGAQGARNMLVKLTTVVKDASFIAKTVQGTPTIVRTAIITSGSRSSWLKNHFTVTTLPGTTYAKPRNLL